MIICGQPSCNNREDWNTVCTTCQDIMDSDARRERQEEFRESVIGKGYSVESGLCMCFECEEYFNLDFIEVERGFNLKKTFPFCRSCFPLSLWKDYPQS